MSSSHDHQTLEAASLESTLSAWKVKYGLPDAVVTALSSLAVTTSTDFKHVHDVLVDGEGGVQVVAAGGRNFNGRISIAFVFGKSSCSIVKEALTRSCDGQRCSGDGSSSWIYPYGKCYIDGRETSTWCCHEAGGQCYNYCKVNSPFQYHACDDLKSLRPLSSAESVAVLHKLQNRLFPKINSEATLLENELRAGEVAQAALFQLV